MASFTQSKTASHKSATFSRGLLLVELLAAFAIISITLVMVADSFILSSKAAATTRRQVEVADALSFALADITREVKVSTDYVSTYNNTTKLYTLGMTRVEGLNNQTADPVEYTVSGGQLMKTVGTDTPLPLTSSGAVLINKFEVEVTDPAIYSSEKGVPRILLWLEAEHPMREGEQPVRIQTTLTERPGE